MSKIVVRQRTVRELQFVCPRCGLDRAGRQVSRRRWWQLAGVPLVPVGAAEPGVACRVCEHRYDLDVLDVPTTAQLSSVLEDATVACVVTILRATALDDHAEIGRRAIDMLERNAYAYDDDRLAHAVSTVSEAEARRRIGRLRHELTPYGKQGLVHRLTDIVMPDARIATSHRDALVDIGRSLGLGAAHVHGLLAVATVDA